MEKTVDALLFQKQQLSVVLKGCSQNLVGKKSIYQIQTPTFKQFQHFRTHASRPFFAV